MVWVVTSSTEDGLSHSDPVQCRTAGSVGLQVGPSASGQCLGTTDTGFLSLPVAPSSCGDEKGRVPLGLYPTCSIPACWPSQRWVMKSCPPSCGPVRVFLA